MKLPEREFKAGDRVWSIHQGFAVVGGSDNDCFQPHIYTIEVSGIYYTKFGMLSKGDVHRSLFTPEEAKELFGVEEEQPKKKVKRWQYLARYEGCAPFESSSFFSSDEEFENEFRGPVWFKRIEESMREFEE